MGSSHSSGQVTPKEEHLPLVKEELHIIESGSNKKKSPPQKSSKKAQNNIDLSELLPSYILNFPIKRETDPEFDARELGEYKVSFRSLQPAKGAIFDGTCISSLLNEKIYHWAYEFLECENAGKKDLDAEKASKEAESEAKIDILNFKRTGLNLTPEYPVPSIDDLDEEIVNWWDKELENQEDSDDSDSETETPVGKWSTLTHNGVYFAPELDPLPKEVFLKFKGKRFELNKLGADMAQSYARLINTEHVKSQVFRDNFFNDFIAYGTESGLKFPAKAKLEDFDFSLIAEYLETNKIKNLSKEEKELKKLESQQLKEKYGFCEIDGKKIELGNFRIEPPGIFMGRGDHPLRGKYKKAITPSMITLNLSEDAPVCPVPEQFAGESWGNIVHNRDGQWIAMWKDPIQNGTKYVRFSSNTHFKGISDFSKFTKARKLSGVVDEVRKKYFETIDECFKFNQLDKPEAQAAIVTHIIDITAIRPGGDKDPTSKAFTVGAQSLMKDNVSFKNGSSVGLFGRPTLPVHLNFKGKDSVIYNNTVHLDAKAVKIMKQLHERAFDVPSDPAELKRMFTSCKLFNKINCKTLNEFMKTLTTEVNLTPKVFRTYNACVLFDHLIRNVDDTDSIGHKTRAYNKANVEVARKCNHQKAITVSSNKAGAKKYARVVQLCVELTISQLEILYWMKISFEMMLGKCSLNNDDMKKIDAHQLRALLEAFDEEASLDSENEDKAKKPLKNKYDLPKNLQPKLKMAATKYAGTLKKLKKAYMSYSEGEEVKNLAANTSKLNYLDPRITVAFCRRCSVPITRFYNKALLLRFPWALDTEADYVFDLKDEIKQES